MADFSFTGRDKANAQDLTNEFGVVQKKFGDLQRNKASELIQALPDDAKDVGVSISGNEVVVTCAEREKRSDDGVRHARKDEPKDEPNP